MRMIEKLYSWYRLQEMKKVYKKHSIKMDPNQKYIFYAIHFEPEAATGVVVDLQNQLTIIQILSQCLPEGWLLYVKDHPHQYNINNTLDHYYLTNIQFFKDAGFYEELLKFTNVRLIDLNTPSEDLIKHCIATSTINGSIILESILCQKPCITFDNQLMAITQKQVSTLIHSFKDLKTLKKFIISLETNETQQFKQDKLQELTQYYFDHRVTTKNINIIESIIKNISHIKTKDQYNAI